MSTDIPVLSLQNDSVVYATKIVKSKTAVQKALDAAQILIDSLMQQYFG